MLDAVTERFVEASTAPSPEALASPFDRMVGLRAEGGKEASRAAVPSAAENFVLDHRIRTALLPRATELDAHLAGLHSDALAAISTAARAIMKRGSLAAGHFDVLVQPIVGCGVELPRYPAWAGSVGRPEASHSRGRPRRPWWASHS
ncbi:hypothetical protein [Streptomyces sp. NBC_00887]|uniref:hypothetical protein n=1 Tax=Streptomyces sp. NBC_00887 TaxID=2975859 RepID=UPI0038689464|nr:hypothetical protein OG844_26700 [Streptomyces sp. NBC_00887]